VGGRFVPIWRLGRMTRRAAQMAAVAVLGALVPLIVLGSLTLSQSETTVRREVAARLRLTTALSGALVAEQGRVHRLRGGRCRERPRLIRALADGDPDRFDKAEMGSQLLALEEYRHGQTTAGLLDLHGILRSVPSSPELVGRDFSSRGYFKGVVATHGTYVSEAFVSAVASHPFVVSIATYVRGSSPDGRGPGPPLAVLAASVQLDEVQHIVDNVVAVQGVNLWIADQKSQLVAAPGGHPTALRQVADMPIGAAASVAPGRLTRRLVDGQDLLVVRQRIDPLAGR